jgi:hypothetical protein
MRLSTSAFFLVFCLATSSFTHSQTQIPTAILQTPASSQQAQPVVRDDAAISLVTASIGVMGGAAINAVTTFVINGNETLLSESGTFVWKESGSSFRCTYTASTSGTIDEEVMSAGRFYRIHAGATKPTAPILVKGHFSPGIPSLKLLQVLNDPSANLTFEGNKQIGTQTLVAVKSVEGTKSIDKLLTTKTWYFDPNTKVLTALDYYVPENRALSGGVILRAMFSDYRPVSGVMMPFLIDIDTNDKQLPITYVINSAALNADLAPAVFQVQ